MSTFKQAISIGLMCKPPRPGVSKTRLAASIGPHAAAQLSEAFVRDCADAVLSAGLMTPLQHTAFYRPHDAADEMRALLGAHWPIKFADAGDLGATMQGIFDQLLAQTADGAIIMGSDVPLTTPRAIANAALELRTAANDVVIIPSADGGYCLIGLRSLEVAARLFTGMMWSTSEVLNETLQRASSSGLRVKLFEAQRDIDYVHDLAWLQQTLANQPVSAGNTLLVLTALQSRSPAQSDAPR